MLTNALAGGLLGAAYLAVLVLQLNPHVPIVSATTWHWFRALGLFYGTHLVVFFYLVIVLRELVGLGVSPGWLSVRLLAWMAALTSTGAATLMWVNVRGFELALGNDVSRRMAAGAVAATAAAGVLGVTAIARYSFGRRGSRPAAAVLAATIVASIAIPLLARGHEGAAPLGGRRLDVAVGTPAVRAGRVVMVLLDGASLEYIWPRAAEGRFPNFGRLLDEGAAMDLATIRPTQPDPVWASVATGKYPPKSGVRSATTYRVRAGDVPLDLLPDYCFSHVFVNLGFASDDPVVSAAVRARRLWQILGGFGLASGIVRWPVTFPARPVRGFLVTDRFHLLSSPLLRLDDEAVGYPAEIVPATRTLFVEAAEQPEIVTAELGATEVPEGSSFGATARWDRVYGRVSRDLAESSGVPLTLVAVRYTGLDSIGHGYLRYALPRSFGDVSEAERRQFGEVLDRYYRFIDGEIGRSLAGLGREDLLLVVSGFGMQPVGPAKRLVARAIGEGHITGTHDRAPDGFLLAYGAHVTRGKLQRGSIVDVAPTVLYFLGLPVGRDMDGYARADLFDRSFTSERPITFIATHDR
jgi:hypothetical protein